jgi:branched-chain amino acid transport system substrate-binding protein
MFAFRSLPPKAIGEAAVGWRAGSFVGQGPARDAGLHVRRAPRPGAADGAAAAVPGRGAASIALFLLVLLFCFSGVIHAAEKRPIRIGFVGGLTGKISDLGIQGRNGAILAVEDVNRQGGIKGRPLKLVVKDDKQDVQTALSVDKQLIDEGVVAIVGHMTSAMSEAAVPLMNDRKMVMISPTTRTRRLSGIDDYFLRVTGDNGALSDLLTAYAARKLKLRRVAATHDLSNRAYSEGFIADFKAGFARFGGKVVSSGSYVIGPDVSFKKLAHAMLAVKPDGLLVAASAIDTAMLCQQVRMTGSTIPILISSYAQSPDLLTQGGPAVEGVVTSAYMDYDSAAKPAAEFRKRFRERFGVADPTFAAVFAYDAVMVLKDALLVNPDPRSLKETIMKQKTFQGLEGPFQLDPYGEGKRTAHIVTVRHNRFTTVRE